MSLLPRLALLSPLALLSSAPQAQVVKLSAPLARDMRAGRVSEHFLTSGGTRVVYRADLTELQWEIFSRPVDGSEPSIVLNSPLQPQGDVGLNGTVPGSVVLGAGDRLVYVADAYVDESYQLFSVPADGSAPAVTLSGPGDFLTYQGFSSRTGFVLTQDGSHVLYRTGNLFDGTGAVHIVPVDGSTPPVTLVQDMNVDGFWSSPDGSQVAFGVWTAGRDRQDLFVVPSDASQAPLLLARTHTPLIFYSVSVWELRYTPDGTRVVFSELEDFDGDTTWQLASVPVDASQARVRLDTGGFNGEFSLVELPGSVRALLQTGGGYASVLAEGGGYVDLTPPGTSRRGFGPALDGGELYFGAFAGSTSIYRVPVDGSQGPSPVCVVDGSLGYLVIASPTRLAFTGYNSSSQYVAFSVPRAGGTPLPLHAPPPTFLGAQFLVPHPDGARILMNAVLTANAHTSLFVVPLDASQPPLELLAPADGLLVAETFLTPDGTRAVSRARAPAALDGDVYQVPLDSSAAPLQLNEAVLGATVGDVTAFQVTPDGTRLVYRADLDSDEDYDLVALDDANVEQRLGSGAGTVLADFALTPDSAHAVFQTREGSTFTLAVAELASGASIVLEQGSEPLVAPFRFDASGERVVYRREISGGRLELRSAPLDGLTGPFTLHDTLGPSSSVGEFRVAGDTAVFVADLAQDNVQELWSAPLSGTTAPIRVSAALTAGGDVTAVELDPNGTLAVFLADARVDGRFELYRAPIDGSAAPRHLSGPLPAGGDVVDFALTPDGSRVVYRADQVSDSRFDLFSVPLDPVPPHATSGGLRRPRGTLLTALGPNRSVRQDWRISPDGTQVVYRADPGPRIELLRVPVDGSTPPVALSGTLGPSADVFSFAIAPDQTRIVFVGDLRANEVQEPYSVPFAGGPVQALDVLPIFGDVAAYRIDPSSHDLVFTADRRLEGLVELYRVPMDGSLPARLLNPALPPDRDVQPDFVPLAAGALYRADQQEDEAVELYLAF